VQRVAPTPPKLAGTILQTKRRPDGRTVVELSRGGATVLLYAKQLVEQVFHRATPDLAAAMVAPPEPDTSAIEQLREALATFIKLPPPTVLARAIDKQRIDPLDQLRRASQYISRLAIELNVLQRQELDDG
jgi:hypothetical protein